MLAMVKSIHEDNVTGLDSFPEFQTSFYSHVVLRCVSCARVHADVEQTLLTQLRHAPTSNAASIGFQ